MLASPYSSRFLCCSALTSSIFLQHPCTHDKATTAVATGLLCDLAPCCVNSRLLVHQLAESGFFSHLLLRQGLLQPSACSSRHRSCFGCRTPDNSSSDSQQKPSFRSVFPRFAFFQLLVRMFFAQQQAINYATFSLFLEYCAVSMLVFRHRKRCAA